MKLPSYLSTHHASSRFFSLHLLQSHLSPDRSSELCVVVAEHFLHYSHERPLMLFDDLLHARVHPGTGAAANGCVAYEGRRRREVLCPSTAEEELLRPSSSSSGRRLCKSIMRRFPRHRISVVVRVSQRSEEAADLRVQAGNVASVKAFFSISASVTAAVKPGRYSYLLSPESHFPSATVPGRPWPRRSPDG